MKNDNQTYIKFANKIAKTMLRIGSSHVYFIIQQAHAGRGNDKYYGKYGELLSWTEAENILKTVINETNIKLKRRK